MRPSPSLLLRHINTFFASARRFFPALAVGWLATAALLALAGAGPGLARSDEARPSPEPSHRAPATASDIRAEWDGDGLTVGIQLVKTAANAADGAVAYVLPNTPVVYTYSIFNTGVMHLSKVEVIEDNGTPSQNDDDFKACSFSTLLAPGASCVCTFTATITNDTSNIAIASGRPANANGVLLQLPAVSDTDDAVVDVVDPAIDLIKLANDAPDGEVAYVLPGAMVTYTYQIVNTGDTYLSDILVNDKFGSPFAAWGDVAICGRKAPLAPGETLTCVFTTPYGGFTDGVAAVVAYPSDNAGNHLPDIHAVSDSDGADVQLGGSLGGRVWWDLNANGVLESGEPGIPGVGVNLSDSSLHASAVTDAQGRYVFAPLPAGAYQVTVSEARAQGRPGGLASQPAHGRSYPNSATAGRRVCNHRSFRIRQDIGLHRRQTTTHPDASATRRPYPLQHPHHQHRRHLD